GIVLRPAAEDLDDAADLVVTADDRVELALARGLGQVAAEALERHVLVLGVLVGHAVAAANLAQRLEQRLMDGAVGAERVPGLAGVLRDREHEVLGRDVLVLQLAHLLLGVAQDLNELARAAGRLCGALELRQRIERLGVRLANRRGIYPELAQDGYDDAALLLEQDGKQMLGHRLRVVPIVGQPLRGLERLLALDRKSVWLHRRSQFLRSLNLSLCDLDYDRFSGVRKANGVAIERLMAWSLRWPDREACRPDLAASRPGPAGP